MEGLASDEINSGVTVMAKGRNISLPYVHPVYHTYVYKFYEKYIKNGYQVVTNAALRRLNKGDVAYFWLGGPRKPIESCRSRGVMVAREMINCTLSMRRVELRKAYALLDLPDGSNISDADIERERQEILASDVVFCPNPHVKKSVVDYGFPSEQCIETSYGWSKTRLSGNSVAVPRDGVFTVAFVGTLDIRKGIPWLLEAWCQANVTGRLVLAGKVDPLIYNKYLAIFNRPDVVYLGHVDDVGSVYRSADVFCMPTWEEGGPLVTLEAMAMGCVPVVTPMGSSGAFNELEEVGVTVAPGDTDAISAAFKRLSQDNGLLGRLSAASKERANSYTWDKVGEVRRQGITQQRNAWLARQ